ncbi:hypothetical protein DH2020_044029 [Rehmannia glutinosa]|uniref:Integrase zinc-binding domain-containing protein n=1 Tax=Rehmannia glutinosa TaxID=99300 RepID=A0ABR0UIG3_REHGL
MHPPEYKNVSDLKMPLLVARIKKDVAEYVSKCLTCQRLKHNIVHQRDRFDRDPRFTPRFWGCLQQALGTKLHFSIAFHPRMQHHSKKIGMVPYEALYGRKCRSPVCWDEEGIRFLEDPDLIQNTIEKVKIVKSRLKALSR